MGEKKDKKERWKEKLKEHRKGKKRGKGDDNRGETLRTQAPTMKKNCSLHVSYYCTLWQEDQILEESFMSRPMGK